MWAQRHRSYPWVVRGAELGKYSLGQGEMSEWFKERAWKVRIPQKGIGGSNPPLSARPESVRARIATMLQSFFCALPTPSLLERGIRGQKKDTLRSSA